MIRSLLICCGVLMYLTAIAQSQTRVTGVVTARDGTTIIANIKIKNSNQGTSSNAEGQYVLEQVPSNAVLVFSSVGYKSTELSVDNRNVINVALDPDDQALDEVMVVAYGTARRNTFTGSAATINQKQLNDIPTVSFENALTGRMAGVQITNASGQAGAAPSIRIRGIGSMNASNEPLYVIDGVPAVSGSGGQMEDYLYTTNNVLNSLNPADIETITVLKDAAASSLYGSRAANGVVLITTKKGKEGKPVINLRSSIGFTPSWATDNYEAAGVQEQVNMLYQIFHDYRTSNGRTEEFANADALARLNDKFNPHGYYFETTGTGLFENVIIKGMTDGLENREGKYYNWDDVMFRTGIYQTNDVSVSGGNNQTTYYSSLAYTQDKNRIAINSFDRITGRVNLSQKVGKYVDFISNVSVSNNKQEGFNDTRNLGGNYFLQSRNLLFPLYWPTDYKTGEPWVERYGSYAYNPVYYQNEWDNSTKTLRVAANETLSIQLLPDLNLKTVFSYENNEVKEHLYYSADHFNGVTTQGSVDEISTSYLKMVSSTTANYNKQFGKHNLGLLAGFEAEKNKTDFQRATGTILPSSALPSVATAGERDASAYNWGYNMMSVLSRAEYNFEERYYASASYRRDGSSRLAPNNRWGNFWSVAGSWRISQESFMQNIEEISNLRLRASYGVNGTMPTENFGWRSLTGYTNRYMGQPGGAITALGNADLTWETNYTYNLALEFGLFKDRLHGSVEYFNRDSKNLLQDVPISRVTGFGSILKNVGEVNNRGFEIELGYDILNKGDWRWSASANASFIKSKVTKLYNGQQIIWNDPTGDDARSQFVYREGESMLSFYGFEWAGVDPSNGRNVWYVNDPQDNQAGAFVFNGRGATYNYSEAERIVLGSAMPDVYGGLNTNIEYKSISLGFNFIYKIGGNLYDGAFKDMADDGYYWERTRAQYYYDHMWTANNTNGTLPKLDGNDLTDPMQYSSRQMYDASFLRLKNINLAYTLPSALAHKIGASNARLYFNGTNLLTFSKYKIADPEVNQYGTRGWETPFGKTYTFGVELSF